MSRLFARSEVHVARTYAAVLKAVSRFGKVRAEEKKTSIQLVAQTGFAGVHPRKCGIVLSIRAEEPIESERVRKVEQVSAHRFHNEVLLTYPDDVDDELVGWLRTAYSLSMD